MILLENITKSYGNSKILSNASLHIEKGELVGIVGRSGSGKTTLLNILGLIDVPDRGKYYFDNNLINGSDDTSRTILRRDKIGFIFQDYGLIKNRKVFYNIALPLMCKKTPKKEIQTKVIHIAKQLNIENLIESYPYNLSGGECQKVAIARALIREPDIILADEPTGSLDEASELEMIEIFKTLNKRGVSILIVTHNQNVAGICDTVYTIKEGLIVLYNKDKNF